ncbi:MAG: acyltransferase [Verrucomicrobiota bacterium]|jgi:acetyltransferase-like isoleucine patch superfamily enzyme
MSLRHFVPKAVRQFLRKLPYWISIPRQWFWSVSQGVRWRYGWRLSGRPIFRQQEGGRILIGVRFSARSKNKGNSIGVFQPVILTARGPGVLEIGDDVGVSGCSITAWRQVVIGNRVLIGAGALILDNDAHPLHPDDRLRNASPRTAAVRIADDVFIGARAIILKGVSIGQGAVIGAGSVVTSDVPAFMIAAGNPARVVAEVKRLDPVQFSIDELAR